MWTDKLKCPVYCDQSLGWDLY